MEIVPLDLVQVWKVLKRFGFDRTFGAEMEWDEWCQPAVSRLAYK